MNRSKPSGAIQAAATASFLGDLTGRQYGTPLPASTSVGREGRARGQVVSGDGEDEMTRSHAQ